MHGSFRDGKCGFNCIEDTELSTCIIVTKASAFKSRLTVKTP